MGGGAIYTKTLSSVKERASDSGGKSNREVTKPPPEEYLSQNEKYATFTKEFLLEAFKITMRNSGGSIWLLPEYIEQAKGILSMLKELFTGEILPEDFIVAMMENALEGIGGDLYFVLTHLDQFKPDAKLTKAQTIELAKRTAGAYEEGVQLAAILYGAVKNALVRKAGAAKVVESRGGLTIINGKVGGKIPVAEYNAIRKASVKNPNAGSMTLGKYTNDANSYIARAGKNSSYFDMGSEWNVVKQQYGLTESEMFEYFNKPAISDAISSGKIIRFSHNPLEHRTGALPQEWEYIKAETGLTDANLIYDGGFWYVKR